MDTIYASATARGKSGVAVIRISGPAAYSAARSFVGSLPEPRVASLRKLVDESGNLLDEALVLVFPAGASFSGEETVEFQIHGSVATVSAVLNALGRIEGLRLAEPGEFTRRALENGCLDLTQVEGLADLIDAETEAQRRQALRVFSGGLGKICEAWRKSLVRAAALIEATIDFVDEDVPVDVMPEVISLLSSVRADMAREMAGIGISESIRDGFEVAIVGPPNAGKSTLLNALAGREAAITSEVAGTTRDVIEVRMDIRGLPVTFLDTAGLRDTSDEVEAIGVERALERAKLADVRVVLLDGGAEYSGLELENHDILLSAKGDLNPCAENPVSGKTGLGVTELVDRLADILEDRSVSAATATRDRHRNSLSAAVRSLDAALDRIESCPELAEMSAEEIRQAVRSMDSLIGRVDVEHLLDEIFSSFCIGK